MSSAHSHQIVQELWNYCNVLRDDLSACGYAQAGGMSYLLARGAQASGDYPSAESILSVAEGLRIGSEQLTNLNGKWGQAGFLAAPYSRS